MKRLVLGLCAAVLTCGQGVAFGQGIAVVDEGKSIKITLTVPSSNYQVKIAKVYQTPKALLVLSRVKGGRGIGLTVISKRQDEVKVNVPDLPVEHYVVGKTWNWEKEKYNYIPNEKHFEEIAKEAKGKLVYAAKEPEAPKVRQYIVMYKKNIFQDGKTDKGETLEQLAKRHSKQFKGQFGRVLRIINGYTVRMSPENAAKLGRLPEVQNVEVDGPVGINPPRGPGIGPRPPIRIQPIDRE